MEIVVSKRAIKRRSLPIEEVVNGGFYGSVGDRFLEGESSFFL